MHILSAIPDNAIADPIYVPERPERHADTQAAGVAALITLAHETTEPAPAPAREPSRRPGAPLPSTAAPAGLAGVPVASPTGPGLAAPAASAALAMSAAPAVSAAPAARALPRPT